MFGWLKPTEKTILRYDMSNEEFFSIMREYLEEKINLDKTSPSDTLRYTPDSYNQKHIFRVIRKLK